MHPPDFISRLPRSMNSNRGHMKGMLPIFIGINCEIVPTEDILLI